MLIDRAVSAYQDFTRVTGWVGDLAIGIEHEFFGRDGLERPVSGSLWSRGTHC